ncbi:MAG: glycosyltransferase family 4 protein [Phycisphaerales bacterium]|nr:glycosyltransferase family 4 protein [Phycisphaerales bacterium]MCI0629368.1 glycosyltransferase family 4 protein [Phycisphaerales bacterium]MCI0676847.1 glycosyltransferase family 4 protein [Phycisphaerales bacterium]
MRIAYVCADRGVPVFGSKGCSVHVQEIMRALLRQGADVELFAAETGGNPPAGLNGATLHLLPSGRETDPESREVVASSVNDALFEGLNDAGQFDAVLERHSLWSYAGMEYAQAHGVPALLEVNAPLYDEQRQFRKLIRERQAEQAVERAFSATSDFLAVSTGVARYLRAHPAVHGRIHILPNGVDPTRFRPDAPSARPKPDEVFTVGFVGGLRPWHGVTDLLMAFAELCHNEPLAQLLIVGQGPLRVQLEATAGELSIGHATTFTGPVDPQAVPGMLTSMDVAVAPYPPLENFYFSPLKLYEYMASGRAIVASSIGQIEDVITDGETGLLYPPGDVKALASALWRLRQNPLLRRKLGSAARELAVRQHSWDHVAHTILQVARMGDSTPAISQRIG